jgi:hypothetical protein
MRLSETRCRRAFVAAALLLFAPAAAAEDGLGKLRIETDPPGAEVLLIGSRAGYTPLTIGERALYPNDYPDDQAHLYGTVTLRRAGCETVVHRVTLDDIARGLHLTLECGAPAVRAAPPPKPEAPVSAVPQAVPSAVSAATATDAVSERRLRQLQVLQELLDEGLIDSAEEQRIRRRLLGAP